MNSMLAFIVSYKERVGEKTSQLKLLSESTGGTSAILNLAGSTSTSNQAGSSTTHTQ